MSFLEKCSLFCVGTGQTTRDQAIKKRKSLASKLTKVVKKLENLRLMNFKIRGFVDSTAQKLQRQYKITKRRWGTSEKKTENMRVKLKKLQKKNEQEHKSLKEIRKIKKSLTTLNTTLSKKEKTIKKNKTELNILRLALHV
ncbi:hypothetical protein RFI_13721 [Reticulomyxa filosa]|uniref:Uncharacterized protein n=1 Tax=Reticulomyxa filosa TaxID=46433 RepID=X6NDQ0_RETFI|nr:hypothetical protein RFI_13721 [Reticulomyxa filosa]|eukprot:ETO23462.1 hypothetical protein RFI_13721 [Reticulomyxa filosa]